MKRTIAILAFLLALSFAIVPNQICLAERPGAKEIPDNVVLSWTADPASTMTITWRAATTVTEGTVEYSEGAILGNPASTAKAAYSTFTCSSGSFNTFNTTLTGLKPNTKYSYRVANGLKKSMVYSFSTADPSAKNFKFLVFGDSQSDPDPPNPYSRWKVTINTAFQRNPDAKFAIITGDIVDSGADERHWNAWFAGAEGVVERIPIMPIVGNHDVYTDGSAYGPVNFKAHFTLPANGPKGLDEQAYTYRYGNSQFWVLTSEKSTLGKDKDAVKPQTEWLGKTLPESDATWKFSYFHRPPFSIAANRNEAKVRDILAPILEKHGVTAVFNGHDHGFARSYPVNGGKIVEGDSKGTIYYVTGRSGDKYYSNFDKKPEHAVVKEVKDSPNYLVVEVEEKKLTITAYKVNGQVLDKYTIDREKDIRTDAGKE